MDLGLNASPQSGFDFVFFESSQSFPLEASHSVIAFGWRLGQIRPSEIAMRVRFPELRQYAFHGLEPTLHGEGPFVEELSSTSTDESDAVTDESMSQLVD